MSTPAWDDGYATGNAMVDDQHRTLFAIFAELAAQAERGADVAPMLARLDQYVSFHFSMEESLMQARQYPGLTEHKRIHDDLTVRAKMLLEDHRKGRLHDPAGAARELARWLIDHIQQIDMAFIRWLRG